MKPHISWLISLPHAMKMFKKMNMKKHRDAGYSFELEEVEDQTGVWGHYKEKYFADYTRGTTIFKLNIYYEKPNETPLTNPHRISSRIPRK